MVCTPTNLQDQITALLNNLENGRWSPEYKAYNYYEIISPLSEGIDTVALQASRLDFMLKDGDNNGNKVLSLLQKPNTKEDKNVFFKKLFTNYQIFGNAYVLLDGNVDSPPLTLQNIPSPYITHIDADTISVQESLYKGQPKKFKRLITSNFETFISADGMQEIIHIAAINIMLSYKAPTPLRALFYELETFKTANEHNVSLLARGASNNLIVRVKGNPTPEKLQNTEKFFNKLFSGSKNTAKPVFIPEQEDNYAFEKIDGQTNKDLDFIASIKDLRLRIFSFLGVPLPLVNAESMTLSNYSTAVNTFFDNKIVPLFDEVIGQLETRILDRFQAKGILSYNPNSVQSIKENILADMQARKNTGVFTINEIREIGGYDPLPDGDTFPNSGGAVAFSENLDHKKKSITYNPEDF